MKTVDIMITLGIIRNDVWDDYIEYLMCIADPNFEVDFVINGTISTIVTK